MTSEDIKHQLIIIIITHDYLLVRNRIDNANNNTTVYCSQIEQYIIYPQQDNHNFNNYTVIPCKNV